MKHKNMMHYTILVVCILFLSILLNTVIANAQVVNNEYLYIGHMDTGMLTIVDTNSNLMVNSSPITSNIQGIVASPSGDYLIASDWDGQQILFVQPLTNKVLFKVPVSGAPYGLAVSNDGKTVYVAIYYEANDSDGNHVAVIDVPSRRVTRYIALTDYARFPRDVKLSLDGEYLYVLKERGGTTNFGILETYFTSNYTYCGQATVYPYGTSMAVTSSYVYVVCNYNSFSLNGTVMKIFPNGTYSGDFNVSTFPYSIAFNKDYTAFYIGCENGGTSIVEKRNYPANTVNSVISIPDSGASQDYAFKVAVSNTGNLYVGHGTNISVYNGNTNTHIADLIPNHGQPYHMAFIIPSYELYSSHLVTFYTKTCYNMLAVTGVNVSIYNSDGQFLYSGVSDSNGVVAFTLLSNAQYSVLFNQSPNINQWYNITPTGSSYTAPIPFSQVVGLTRWSDTMFNATVEYQTSWSLSHTYNSTTNAAWMNSTYTDVTASTAGFFLYKNGSFGGTDSLVDQSLDSSAPYMANFSIASATGNSYYIVIRSNTTNGQKNYSSGLACTFPGPKVLAGVFPSDWYFWLAWSFVLIFYTVGTITKKGLFAIFGAVAGAIMVNWGWYSLVFPDYIAYPAIGLTFIIAIIVTLQERERYT